MTLADDNPILNNPYQEPALYYNTNYAGEIDYSSVIKGRRPFVPDPQAMPVRQNAQQDLYDISDRAADHVGHPVNLLRKEVGDWRRAGYPASTVTRVTGELLRFWFENPGREHHVSLFFAQREAIETAIWLNEVAPKCNPGQHILSLLEGSRAEHMAHGGQQSILPRIGFKMATGTGKTVVMAALILYHFFNRREYRQDTRFADYFLIVTPGVTIKNRLSVLLPSDCTDLGLEDYYKARWLVPPDRDQEIDNLNSRIVITNYHTFEPKTLQGNKRSPYDGKRDADGKKQEGREDFSLVVKRLMGNFRADSRLLVLNDEAHHCYLPKEKGKSTEGEDTVEENKRASVWFRGLTNLAGRFKIETVYDLSATPYYLTGSGFDPYSLFPWVVSDFGLTEAIESGLVKIPFLPESDNTQVLAEPVLRNIYEHVRDDLPKKGQKTAKSEAKKAGKALPEAPPNLPGTVKSALEMLNKHYKEHNSRNRELFDHPPVFIAVCNNTSVSKEVYKHLAGYEWTDEDGETRVVPGVFDLFSNYDPVTHQPVPKPPTLLIDSDAIEDSGQIDAEFKRVFAREIELFKRDYVRIHGHGSIDKITDAEILREVVNTVGKTGMLGSHVRCVVSVSMLTEGWDANTVTHIFGLRAFGSQLLCEQVAGRGLRRQSYMLQGYDKQGNPVPGNKPANKIVDWKFAPEYAQIVGIPFKSFKTGATSPPPPLDTVQVDALPEREADYEITFPNVVGYRVEHQDAPITADFSDIEPFEFDGSAFPIDTIMASAFSEETQQLTIRQRLERLRDQELIYSVCGEMLRQRYRDENGQPQFQRFPEMKRIVEEWYHNHVRVLGSPIENPKRLLFFENPDRVCTHINRGIMSASKADDIIRPVLNYYNKLGSTRYVHASTTREVYATRKSHVNYVVADTQSWEQIAAKALDDPDLDDYIISYVKNAYLGFTIPYVNKQGENGLYYPDFIARCRVPSPGGEGKGEGARALNLIIEITGMNTDKHEKRQYVRDRWLKAVNSEREAYGWDEWRFMEVMGDIRDIKNEIIAEIRKG